MKVKKAIERLSKILPIKKTLDVMDKSSAGIYLAVLNGFYDKGRAPSISELAAINKQAEQIVKALAEQDMLTLDDEDNVTGCYPFTMEKRVHRIQLNGFDIHAMCALDALAPSAMFECPSVVMSECEVTKVPLQVELNNQQVVNPSEMAELHFGINWMAASSCGSCSETLCTEMLFLKDNLTAQDWLNEDMENREIFTLPQAIEFSAGFFKPMMRQG